MPRSRRQFLKTTGAVASTALFSGPILDFLGVTDDAFAAEHQAAIAPEICLPQRSALNVRMGGDAADIFRTQLL